MGKDQRLAAIERFLGGVIDPSDLFRAWPKMEKKDNDSDGDDDDEDDDATDADDDDDDESDSDEEQDDSSDGDDDDDQDDDAEDDKDDKSGKSKRREPGFKAPKSQEELDRMIAKRLARKEREVRQAVKDEEALQRAKKRGDSDKVIEALEKKIADLEVKTKEATLTDLRISVAKKVGLPASFASRLQGENEAELRVDAKALKKELGITSKTADSDDRGKTNRSRKKVAKTEDDEAWKTPGFFTQD